MDFFRGLKNHFIPSHHNEYRPHLLRRSWLIVFLGIILAAEGFLVAVLIGRQAGEDFLAAVLQSELIALTNEERAQQSLGILTENTLLTQAAFAKARDMAAKEYFAHQGPDGKMPWLWIQEAGYAYQSAGENLAVRFVDSEDVVEAWMNSPSHRANIVKENYTEIGMGIAEGRYKGAPATYVVEFFARPQVAVTEPVPAPVELAEDTPVIEEEVAIVEEPAPVESVPENEPTPSVAVVSPVVAAAETSAPASIASSQGHSLMQTIERIFARILTEPRATTAWILGGMATLLVVLLALSFFVHVQVQHGRMLLGGAMVGLFALGLLALNGSYFGVHDTLQSASVIEATSAGEVEVSDYGYWISFE